MVFFLCLFELFCELFSLRNVEMHLPAKCVSTVLKIHISLLQVNTRTDRRLRASLQLCPAHDLAGDCSCEGGTVMDYVLGAAK